MPLPEIFSSNTLLLILVALFCLYLYAIRHNNYWKNRGVPYFKPLPFVGNFLDIFLLRKHAGSYLKELYDQMSAPFFGLFVFDQPYLVVRSPELLKLILVKDFGHFADRAIVSDEKCDPFFAHFLFAMKNPEWKLTRQKMTTAFTNVKMTKMFGLVNEVGENMNVYLKTVVRTDEILEAKDVCIKFTTDVISSCAFGINARSFEGDDVPFRKVVKGMFDTDIKTAIQQTSYFFFPGFVRLFKMKFIDPSISKFLTDAFWTTINERERIKIKRNDLIDIIIEMRGKETQDDKVKLVGNRGVSQAGQFFAAGFETTSTTMAFALYELALNSKIQGRLRDEIKNCVAAGFNYEAIKKMKYLDMALKEALRKYPSVPFLDRMCVKDYKIPNTNVVIQKGISVFVPMLGLHYDPDYYPQPEKFDPERFAEENKGARQAFTFISFGEGPRHCLGKRFAMLAAKVGLAHLLLEFEVEKCEKTPASVVLDPKTFLTVSTVGLPIRLKRLVSKTG